MRKYTPNNKGVSANTSLSKKNKKIIILGVVAIAIILTLIIGISRAVTNITFNRSFLETRDLINIGIRTDISPFGQIDENGAITGFDKDIVDAILAEIIGDSTKLYEYNTVSSQEGGAAIKYAKDQIVLGMLIEGTEKTKGFLLTKPYYYDDVVAVAGIESKVESLKNIEGNKIGVLSNAISMTEFEKYLERHGLEFELFRYTDYESALIDLQHNRINTFVAPRAIANTLNTNLVRILNEPLYQVGYCIMLPSTQFAVQAKMNGAIDVLNGNGGIEIIKEKWGLIN